jgi:hypothetical protein
MGMYKHITNLVLHQFSSRVVIILKFFYVAMQVANAENMEQIQRVNVPSLTKLAKVLLTTS